MKEAILLTGGSGFIGINIAEIMLSSGYKVIILSRDPPPNQAMINFMKFGESFVWLKGDVQCAKSVNSVLSNHEIDYVIHAAAITPDEYHEKENMSSVFNINCMGTINLLKEAKLHKCKRFIYISSVAVYGDIANRQDVIYEDSASNPQNTYEITKFAAEKMVARFAELHEMDAVALRLGDVYGAWEYRSGSRSRMSAPFQTVYMAIKNEKVIMEKPGNTAWINVNEVSEIVKKVLETKKLNHYEYNCGGITKWSIKDMCEIIKSRYPMFDYEISESKKPNVTFFSKRDNGIFSINRLINDTGYTPEKDYNKEINNYLDWVEQNSEVILSIPLRAQK